MHLLETEHLTKDYGRYRVLADVNLTVKTGEIFGLLGPNGSGKTTALRLLLGFLKPTAGRALIGGHDCWRSSVAARRQVNQSALRVNRSGSAGDGYGQFH